MVTKDEVDLVLRAFVLMAKTQFSVCIKIIRSESALELKKSSDILDFIMHHGIIHQTSCVQTPKQNRVLK